MKAIKSVASFNNEDNTVKYMALKAVWLLLFIIFLSGCASQLSLEDRGNYWIGRPLAELKQEMKNPDSYASKIGWAEITYPLASGDFVYVQPVSADCSLHWEIDQGGIIIGYQAKGNGCKPGKGSGGIIRTQSR